MQISKILEKREVKSRASVEGLIFDGSTDTPIETGEDLGNMGTSINKVTDFVVVT